VLEVQLQAAAMQLQAAAMQQQKVRVPLFYPTQAGQATMQHLVRLPRVLVLLV
jgi:hypothetical protein